jgi:hypothetical protein
MPWLKASSNCSNVSGSVGRFTVPAPRRDVFDYIEMFYNPKARNGSNRGLPPVEPERRAGNMDSNVSTKAGAIQSVKRNVFM